MRAKMLIFLIASILSTSLIGCSNSSESKNQDHGTAKNTDTNELSINTVKEQDVKVNSSIPPAKDVVKEDDNIIPTNTSEPLIERMELDSETEKFFYGTWKVEKLLGFSNSYNDASEYPTGQKIIGDEIIINKDFFSSKGLKSYNDYQYEIPNPVYNIIIICYNEDSFYRLYKTEIPGMDINDEIKNIDVSITCLGGIPVSFLVVNNDRLILSLEATIFELKKVTD